MDEIHCDVRGVYHICLFLFYGCGGYGAVISRLYPTEIRSSANNIIVNVGRAIGGFSSVVIGILMDKYNLGVVMGFLSALYLLSFTVMITLPGLKTLTKEAKRN